MRDPRSGIRKKPIPDPGSRGQKAPNPGSRIRIRNTGFRVADRNLHVTMWCRSGYEVYGIKIYFIFFVWERLIPRSQRFEYDRAYGTPHRSCAFAVSERTSFFLLSEIPVPVVHLQILQERYSRGISNKGISGLCPPPPPKKKQSKRGCLTRTVARCH